MRLFVQIDIRRWIALLLTGSVAVGTVGCHDLSGIAGKSALPAGLSDPSAYSTAAGALALYNTTLAAFQYTDGTTVRELGSGYSAVTNLGAFMSVVVSGGLLSDELRAGNLSLTPFSTASVQGNDALDGRQLPDGVALSGSVDSYSALQSIRGGANLAIGALRAYDSSAPPALMGHLFALKGYAEILLADLYCSGVPLSSVDFNGNFTYHAGSTTDQLYQDAIAQFDTAIALATDSSRILNLARVGKGRALLGRGLYDSAAVAVQDVPDGFSYQFPVDWTGFFTSRLNVANREGGNGLPYVAVGAVDRRVTSKTYGWSTNMTSPDTLYAPVKYGTTVSPPAGFQMKGAVVPVTVADWIEARLIRAEAALADGNTAEWYNQLHYLRQHGATAVIPDTLPGDTLADPGTQAGRVAVLFRERAYWLFVTGHRQGDLRRLVRQYDLDADQLYPIGTYPPGTGLSVYGEDVTIPVPSTERTDPLFTGCLSRGA